MLFLLPLGLSSLTAQDSESQGGLPELEMFIADESASALNDTVMPTDREISGLFTDVTSILEIPRSVSLLSPEILDQFNIDDLRDLEKVGAGTQALDYYGVPGAPTIRGAKGGTYLNGMLRAYNRNEMPLSFGSLEAIEVVKGPAPADFSPTLIGGFVNLIPKTPYYDEEKGSIEFQFDNWGRKTSTADYGAPFLISGEIPAAYRVSITGQDGESYYDDLSNDYTSVYGSIKFRPKRGVSVFVGGEYFDFKSNENPGWNRPTQQLVDTGAYVIGEPQNITNGTWRGTASRDDIYNDPRLAIERSLAEALVPQFGNLEDMEFITDTDGVEKYVYTSDYFANGGTAVTRKIDGNVVLTDPSDFADSTDTVLFADIVLDSNPERTVTIKGIAEFLETEKNSSYGYAFASEQTLFGAKAYITDRALIPNTSFSYGIGTRFLDATQLQDFWDEPFSRRDISEDEISPNSIILSGAQFPIGGNNQWGRFGIGGNSESELMQLSTFINGQSKFMEGRLTFLGSARFEYADFDVVVPSEVDGISDEARADYASNGSDDTDYLNWNLGFNFEVAEGAYLYGTYLEGTSMDPSQGGALVGEANFAENEMSEVGIKSNLLDENLFASIAYYDWEQSAFNGRAGSSEPLSGEGFEFETTWLVNDFFTLIGSFTSQEVMRETSLGFRTIPFSEQDWALYGGELNSNFGAGSFDGRDRYGDNFGTPPTNPNLVYPGPPEEVIKLFGIYDFQNGFEVTGGVVAQDEFYLDFDRQIVLPDALIWSLGVNYSTESWDTGLTVENLTDEDYFLGSDPTFAANTLVSKAPERTFVFTFRYKF